MVGLVGMSVATSMAESSVAMAMTGLWVAKIPAVILVGRSNGELTPRALTLIRIAQISNSKLDGKTPVIRQDARRKAPSPLLKMKKGSQRDG